MAALAHRTIIDDPRDPLALAMPATIITLAADWLAARSQAEAEEARFQAAKAEAEKLYSPPPPGGVYPPFLFAKQQEAAERWWAQVAAIDASFGVPGLEQVADRAWSAADQVAEQILTMRPANAQEAAVKFGVLLKKASDFRGRIDEPERVFAFLADLEHLARQ